MSSLPTARAGSQDVHSAHRDGPHSSINVCVSPGTGYAPEQSKSRNKVIALGNATVTQHLLHLPN